MSILGIIAEYNPFHNGHLYHLKKSKALTGADFTICVMSGNFVQRGSPALSDKWSRTEIALKCGVDLVIELPAVFAMSSAEYFAGGGVKLLDSLGIVDFLSFGSECGRLDELKTIAGILNDEPAEYKSYLKKALDTGISYPAARENALNRYLLKNAENNQGNSDSNVNPGGSIEGVIKSPNNILGIEYLKALMRIGSKIKPVTIGRTGGAYNSDELQGSISSATAIRNHIQKYKSLSSLDDALPHESMEILTREFKNGRGPVFPEDFGGFIISALRRMKTDEISRLPYIAEGLENRIKSAAEASGTLEELVESISTRRYTETRVLRCLFHILTGLDSKTFNSFIDAGGPQYIRILGFTGKGRQLLPRISSSATLPLIVKAADYKHTYDTTSSSAGKSENPLLSAMLGYEAASTDQYVLAFGNASSRASGREFTQQVVITD